MSSPFKLQTKILAMSHREFIMAKREFYSIPQATQRPFGLTELFTTDDRRKLRLPHQGTKECARRRTTT